MRYVGISFLLLVLSCQSVSSGLVAYEEVRTNFTEAQIADLEELTRFFESHACEETFSKPCLEEYLYQATAPWQHTEQQALYQRLNSGVTGYFWLVGWQNVQGDSLAYQFYTPDGPYLRFLKSLAEEKEEVRAYLEELIRFGDLGPKSRQLFASQAVVWDLSDPRIQLLISIHELSNWDNHWRRERLY